MTDTPDSVGTAIERLRIGTASRHILLCTHGNCAPAEGAKSSWKYLKQRLKELLNEPLFIDLRNVYEPAKMAAAGFRYVSLGRPEGRGPAADRQGPGRRLHAHPVGRPWHIAERGLLQSSTSTSRADLK